MAKGARASTKKANNQKLKSRVFGPVESARTERLSAKLLELASQPKPKPVKEDIVMESDEGTTAENNEVPAESKQAEEMVLDQETTKSSDRPKSSSKGRIEKRRHHRKASIVFPKYSKGKRIGSAKGRT
ncbi:hypothetical protein N431DRAFT_371883 [Stipitochalara longipes BDJ]|nr:hypothetical protein N431DRAFT_371883 [Stipitochalara longipes BDJ]